MCGGGGRAILAEMSAASRRSAPSVALLVAAIACAPGPSGGDGSGSSGSTSASSEGSAEGSASESESEGGGAIACEPGCAAGETCEADGVCRCSGAPGSADDTCPPTMECGAARRCFGPVWPNRVSRANSDPWLMEHHHELRAIRPRVLALNFVNKRSMAEMAGHLRGAVEALAEGSRFHGYADAAAPVFLDVQVPYGIDLRDAEPPAGWPYNNSTLYPREDPQEGYWSFDYERLFSDEFAALYKIEDPAAPGTYLDLCRLFQRGLVHEVWIYGDADKPDASAAEILEVKPRYDADRRRLPGAMNRCAGNGCFDEEDVVACGVTVRIAWFNNTRGVGCFLESLSHGLESTGNDLATIPYLHDYFPALAGFDLDARYGLPVKSWYSCPYGQPCLSYPSPTSVSYAISDAVKGTIEPYDPVCGNVHFAPNGREQYDLGGPDAVRTSCGSFRDGSGGSMLYDKAMHATYAGLAPDCMGQFTVWWRQNLPGLDNHAIDDDGLPMLNWWPFLYY